MRLRQCSVRATHMHTHMQTCIPQTLITNHQTPINRPQTSNQPTAYKHAYPNTDIHQWQRTYGQTSVRTDGCGYGVNVDIQPRRICTVSGHTPVYTIQPPTPPGDPKTAERQWHGSVWRTWTPPPFAPVLGCLPFVGARCVGVLGWLIWGLFRVCLGFGICSLGYVVGRNCTYGMCLTIAPT